MNALFRLPVLRIMRHRVPGHKWFHRDFTVGFGALSCGVLGTSHGEMIPADPMGAPITTEAKRELAQRIVSSPRFQRSPRLRDFFLYICEESLAGRADTVHEQQIGIRVFGLAPSTLLSSDAIFRINPSDWPDVQGLLTFLPAGSTQPSDQITIFDFHLDSMRVTPVPEPGTLALLALGLFGLIFVRRPATDSP